MSSQRCILLGECVKCKRPFDMGYDYTSNYETSDKKKKDRELMCWECRESE